MNYLDIVKKLKTLPDEEASELIEGLIMMKSSDLLNALAFYADPTNYIGIAFMFDSPGNFANDWSETDIGSRPGKRAREAVDAIPMPDEWTEFRDNVIKQYKEYMIDRVEETFDSQFGPHVPITTPPSMYVPAIKNRILYELESIDIKEK